MTSQERDEVVRLVLDKIEMAARRTSKGPLPSNAIMLRFADELVRINTETGGGPYQQPTAPEGWNG